MAPPLRQDIMKYPTGSPDILPALLPMDPATWPAPPVPQPQQQLQQHMFNVPPALAHLIQPLPHHHHLHHQHPHPHNQNHH